MFKFIFFVPLLHANGWVITDIANQDLSTPELDRSDELNAIELDRSDELNPPSHSVFNKTLKLTLVYPGTKWCGPGNVANDFNDLGSEWKTDMCCREHDYCPDSIPAGEAKHNLTNEAFYTRLNCDCDDRFRECLKAANTLAAENIGVFYFNALSTKCYRKDYPVLRCLKRGGWLLKKCLAYSYDTTGEKVFQWFDVHTYR